MYGETLDFNVSITNGNINYPIGKSIFAVNLPSKVFRATVTNVDIGSLSFSIHSLQNVCSTCKWNLNKIVWSKLHEILSFLRKTEFFYNHFWQSVDAILEDVSVAEPIMLNQLFNAKLLIWRLPSFIVPNITVV